jgi:hypothetical protein
VARSCSGSTIESSKKGQRTPSGVSPPIDTPSRINHAVSPGRSE